VSGRCTEAAWRNACLSGTTHNLVVDGNGDAASCRRRWLRLGSGGAGHGIHLNNMLGEYDLAGPSKAGSRLTSMMARQSSSTRTNRACSRERGLSAPPRRDHANRRERGGPWPSVEEAIEAPRKSTGKKRYCTSKAC